MARNFKERSLRPTEQPVLVLVVDAGATHARAAVADLNGIVLGRGAAGPANSYAVGQTRAFENLRKAILQALKRARLARVPNIRCRHWERGGGL